MIDITRPFCLFALVEVIYDGRAYSTLEVGNYLIVHKGDGSIQIHGSSKIPPRNYQGPKSTLEQRGHLLISRNKKEVITIVIHHILHIAYLNYWSDAEIQITRTEQELVDKIFHNWNDYIDIDMEMIKKEHPTEHGPVDLLGIQADLTHHIIEVKRRKVSIKDVTQLKRYVEVFEEQYATRGYLASPSVGDKAMAYLEKHGYQWFRVDF